MKPIVPTLAEHNFLIANTAWFIGFFDAEGCFSFTRYQFRINISQKEKQILDSICDAFGLGKVYPMGK
jgi:hypothetical protein